MTINELKKEFMSQYAMASKHTQKRNEELFNFMHSVLKINTVEDLNNADANLLSEYARANNWAPSTLNLRLGNLKQVTAWCKDKGYITRDCFKEIKKVTTSNYIHFTPSDESCHKLITYIKEHTDKKRLLLMTKMILCGGLRRSEVCDLKVSDLDKENLSVRVVGKGKKIVEQPLPANLVVELTDYINTERKKTIDKYIAMGGKDKGYMFVSGIGDKCNVAKKDLTNGNKVNDTVFYMQIKRYAKLAGLENADQITLHSIRRRAGTNVYEKTNDIRTAQEFLRHSNIATTQQHYVDYDRTKVKDVVRELYDAPKENNNFTQDDEYQLYLLLKKKFGKDN